MIGVIAYGAGNLKSVQNALTWLGVESRLVEKPAELVDVRAVILPGVGAFGPAMARLVEKGFATAIRDWAAAGRPLLGICLGMQLLARSSEEGGEHAGLDLVEARIVKMKGGPDARIPHMGWNTVKRVRPSKLWGEIEEVTCYHVHSYRFSFDSEAAERDWTVGIVEHGERFASMIERGNVMGTQFHPEKSQADGLAVLRNFVGFAGSC
jgi:glutamine amidotransferase